MRKIIKSILVGVCTFLLLSDFAVPAGKLHELTSSDTPSSTKINENFTWVTPVGGVMAYMGATAPYGWFGCDGQALSSTNYPELYAAIGTRYGTGTPVGTEAKGNFNVPDLRGYFLRGQDSGVNRDPNRAVRTASGDGTGDSKTGDNVGTRQGDIYGQHSHTYGYPSYDYLAGSGAGFRLNKVPPSANTGSSGGSETRPKNVNVMWIIRAE